MITICWKELRENYRWALLAMLGLGFAQWHALHAREDTYSLGYTWTGKGLLLCSPVFLAVTTFGCAAVGLLLGLVQILPELRRDQWASLLHRPVSRGVIFRGKVVGGLILYLLATVPPFLHSIWLVATPGHFAAPFVPSLALAGTADLCAGAAFYFAALAMVLPRGGWFGWRLLPLLAASHLVYFVHEAGLFRVAVEAVVLMSLLLFAAGWATMLHQEKMSLRPWIGKAACLGAAFYGMCGLGDLSLSILEVIGPTRHSRSVQYNLSDTGIPLRLTYVDDVVVSVTDPTGNTPSDKRFQSDQVRSHMRYLNGFSQYIGDAHGWSWSRYQDTYRNFYRYATFTQAYAYPRAEQWFYLLEQKVWIGYSLGSKLPLERLDRRGFVPLSNEPESLSAETTFSQIGDHLILHDNSKVQFVSLPRRQITELALPSVEPIYGVGTAYANTGNGSVSIFGITLADRLAVYDERGALFATLPYHQDVSRWGQLSLGMNGSQDRFYLRYEPSAWLPGEIRDQMSTYLDDVDAQGAVKQTYTLPPVPPFWQSRAWPEFIAHRLQSPTFFFGSMGYQKFGALFGSKRLADQLAWRLGHERNVTWQQGTFSTLLALALAVGTWVWTRRERFSIRRALAWTLFVSAGGLAGLAAFCALADRTLSVPCPRCRRSRPIDDERCPNCGEVWPTMPAEGTEIFDRDGALTLVGAQV